MHALLQMWGPFRQSLIDQHLFYMEQARKRLLSQFENIEEEASIAAEKWFEEHGTRFDPDRHDVGDFYEASHEVGIEFYQLLSDMRDQTRLSVVAGMFHEWDKQLRDWLTKEIRHWHQGDIVKAKVWSANFECIADLLESFGWKIRGKEYFDQLNACRCVVNVYKHGNGNSLDELKRKYPEYIVAPYTIIDEFFPSMDWLDHTYIKVSDDQLQAISDAILAFWQDVPEQLSDHEELSVPDWFAKAILRDREGHS